MYLEAASIGDLYMSCSGSFISSGVLNTLVAQANGAGNKRLGAIWLNVSLYCIFFVTLIVMVLWFFTENVVQHLGVQPEIASNAGFYAKVLLLCLPARAVMGQLAKFFAANQKPYPQVVIMTFAATLNLVLGLIFVVGFPFKNFDGFGFKACPIVTTTTEWTCCLIFILFFCSYKKMHLQFGWESFDLKEITNNRTKQFLKLYIPRALSTFSDFFRVSVIGIFAATLSDIDIAVFNTGYRFMWLGLTLIGAFGSALSVRLGYYLGSGDSKSAKQLLNLGYFYVTLIEVVLFMLVLTLIEQLASVFSNDQEVIERFVAVKLPLSVMLLSMTFSVYLESLIVGMGKTKEVLQIGIVGSWLCQVPLSYIFVNYVERSLYALYWGVSLGYVLTCLGLLFVIAKTSWDTLIQEAEQRSEVKRRSIDKS